MSTRQATARTATALTDRFGARPWTTADALGAGISRGQLRAAINAGHARPLRVGGFVTAQTWDRSTPRERFLLHARAAVMLTEGGVLSHRTGLVVHRTVDPWARGPDDYPAEVDVTVRGTTGWRSSGLRVHGCPLPDEDIVDIDGMAVTSLARTVVDVARATDRPRALIAIDAALRRGLLDRVEPWVDPRDAVHDVQGRALVRVALEDVCERMWGWPGIRTARWAVEHGEPAAESPLESLSRGHVLLGGLPPPRVGVPVAGDGGTTYWADMCWPTFRVIGEADGRMKYATPKAVYAEKLREDSLRRAGWVVVRWTWEEIVRRPEVVLQRIRAALIAAGWRP